MVEAPQRGRTLDLQVLVAAERNDVADGVVKLDCGHSAPDHRARVRASLDACKTQKENTPVGGGDRRVSFVTADEFSGGLRGYGGGCLPTASPGPSRHQDGRLRKRTGADFIKHGCCAPGGDDYGGGTFRGPGDPSREERFFFFSKFFKNFFFFLCSTCSKSPACVRQFYQRIIILTDWHRRRPVSVLSAHDLWLSVQYVVRFAADQHVFAGLVRVLRDGRVTVRRVSWPGASDRYNNIIY